MSIHRSLALLIFLVAAVVSAQSQSKLLFRVSLDPAVSARAVSGRLIVFMTNNPKPQEILEPGSGEGSEKTWMAAREITDLAPGSTVELDPDEVFFPQPLSQAAVGEYQVMAMLDVDHNAAYNLFTNPDLRSPVVLLKALNPAATEPIELKLSEHVPQHTPAALVKGEELVDFVSPSLSRFWGRPIHMGAVVVLPPGYATSKQRYPTVYMTHGFGGKLEYLRKEGAQRAKNMEDGNLPPMIWVILDESCPGGTHEFADSVNNGPWGHALITELIPYLERKYRMDARPGGRFLTGHSSGGWATMWLLVTYPRVFGGTWSTSPDPVDFRDFTNTDLSKDENVYHRPDGSPTRLIREGGKDIMSFEEYSHQEAVMGEYGGQISSFDWVFSPRRADGRPQPLFERETGQIDHDVVKYWLDHYDISRILTSKRQALLPLLRGKIHIVVGTADTFYLDGAVHLLQQTINPLGYDAKITFLEGRTHMDVYKGGLETRIAWQMYDLARPKNSWKPNAAPDASTELAR